MTAHKKFHDIDSTADHGVGSIAASEVVANIGGVLDGKAFTTAATAGTLVERDGSGHVVLPSSPDPTGNQATSATYVDTQISNALAGLDWQADVDEVVADASTTGPGTGLPASATGQRYILQSGTGSLDAGWGAIPGVADNDIVEYNGTSWEVVYDVSAEGEGALVWDKDSDQFYRYDGTSWDPFGGLSGVTAGDGLEKTGNKMETAVSTATVSQQYGAIVENRTADGSAAAAADSGHLSVQTDDTTLEVNSSNQLQIKAGSDLSTFKGIKTYAGAEPVFSGELNALTVVNDWAFFKKTGASTFLVFRRATTAGDATDFDAVELTSF
jgi:hypothetical protein